ncbi:MAG: rhodanese-like domain-containing protein [Bacteroidota bacterium]
MKNTFILFALLFLLGTKGFSQTATKDSIQVLSIAQFEKMASKKKSKIIDVRTPEEVAEGHLAGASPINFLSPDFATQVASLNKKGTYLLYCRSGARTRKAADAMQKMGFKRVYMLDGGINAWKEAGKTVEK